MRRGIGIVLLAAGTVLGFGWGFARVSGHCPYGYGCHGPGFFGHGAWGDHRQSLEDRAADACVRAAERVMNERKTPAPATPGANQAPNP
ncbi:MAG TPA: hypothetical protein VMI54_07075 [Polyangiaceae bacterium]|nr:hypothetical protein [Polyangiaceae bacterium]